MTEEHLGLMVWNLLAADCSAVSSAVTRLVPTTRRNSFDFPPVEREPAYGIVDAIRPIAGRHNVSVARIALAWLLH